MALGLGSSLIRGGASLLTFVKDNLKLYLDFKSNRSDTLAFPSEGSTNFDGTDDYINFGDLNISFPFSLSLWVRPDVLEEGPIFGIGSIWSTHEMTIYQEGTGGGVRWRINVGGSGGPGTSMAYENGVLTAGKWTHIAITADGTTGCMYIDGVRIGAGGSLSGTMFDSGQDNILGYQSGLGAQYFDGSMCNFGLWSRGLSGEEVQSVMNKSYSQLSSVEKTSLVMWQSLDSQSDGLVQPASGEELGSELFTSVGNTTGWSYDSSAETLTASSTSATAYTNVLSGVSEGDLVKLSFDVTGHTGGSVYISCGGGNQNTSDFTNGSHTIYLVSGSGSQKIAFDGGTPYSAVLSNISVKEVTSNTGVVTGATTTTSVYGGNAPVLPRAIDIAESFADAIGNGSAYFVKSNTDYIQADNHNLLVNGNATMACWAKATAISQEQFFGGHHNSKRFYFGISSANKPFFGVQDQASSDGDVLNISANEWNHYALVANGGTATFYFNGINVHTMSYTQASASNPDNLFVIGARNDGGTGAVNVASSWDGYIGQYGLWQGALTQAQIQSLMESTSYAKIPADVKSTLGSELVGDPSFDDASYYTIFLGTGTVDINTTNTGKLTAINAQDKQIIRSNVTESGKLYKATITLDSYTDGSIGGVNNSTGLSFGTLGVGTFTGYFVASGTTLNLKVSGNADFTATDISVKEVTNDLVAYYPLDADSSDISSLGITNDSVNGETLGINLIDNHNKDRWISAGGNSDDDITNGVQLIFGGGASGNYAYINDALLSTAGLASDTLYKTTFTASYSGGSSAPSIRLDDGTTTYDNVLTTTPTEYEVYFMKNGSPFLQIINQVTSNVTDVINWTIKEVTSNTGVLK